MKRFIALVFVIAILVCSISSVFAAGKYGDVDNNDTVNIFDATEIQNHIAEITQLSDDALVLADVDDNGSITIMDVTTIQFYLAEIITSFPVEDNQTEEPTEPVVPEDIDFAPVDSIEGDIVTAEMLWKMEQEFYRLVNEERVNEGREPLVYNKHLDDIAQIRSSEITKLYSHNRPNGMSFETVIDVNKYPYRYAGENICYYYHLEGSYSIDELEFTGSDKQIKDAANIVFNAFKNSSGHYANMINRHFEDAGIGISYVWDTELDVPRFYLSHNFGTMIK